MKIIPLSRKSCHYHFATVYGLRRVNTNTDICTYARQVIFGLCASISLFSLFVYALLTIVVWVAAMISTGQIIAGNLAVNVIVTVVLALFVGVAFLALVACFMVAGDWIGKKRRERRNDSIQHDSVIHTWWTNVKQKTCARIVLK